MATLRATDPKADPDDGSRERLRRALEQLRAVVRERGGEVPEATGSTEPPADRLARAGWEALGANEKGFPEYRNPVDGAPMILIPGPGGQGHLLVAKYEVSNQRYRSFLAAEGEGFRPPHFPRGEDEKAVVGLEVVMARAYADWVGGRLPTREEWLWAARAGTSARYPWGDDRMTVARANVDFENHRQMYLQQARRWVYPIQDKAAGQSPYGVFQMVGNAAEWVETTGKPQLMGGSWRHSPGDAGLGADERFSSSDFITAGVRPVCDLP